jgi:hypothetical protein
MITYESSIRQDQKMGQQGMQQLESISEFDAWY